MLQGFKVSTGAKGKEQFGNNAGAIRDAGGVFLLVFESASPDECGFGHVAGRHFLLLFFIFLFFSFLSFLLVNGGSETPGRWFDKGSREAAVPPKDPKG